MAPTAKDWNDTLASLPVSSFFSAPTWTVLKKYVETGHQGQRGYRLIEFFKALDWLPLDEIEPNPLRQLSSSDKQRVLSEVVRYCEEKQSKKQAQKEKREHYKLKVFEYFRSKVSAEDKAKLERLRDYELEKIGQDVNWKHYFWFTSFKQIDAFVGQTQSQRLAVISQFKQDVDLHYKNAQRLREGTYASYYWGEDFGASDESFDDWVNRQQNEFNSGHHHGALSQKRSLSLQQAFENLELPQDSQLKEVRAQFRKLALQFHPDHHGGSSEKMRQILDAYEVIKKSLSR